MAGEYVFNLQRVTKQYNRVNGPGRRHPGVLLRREDRRHRRQRLGQVHAAAHPGRASTRDFMGEAQIAPGTCKIGYLPQEPQLDPSKTVAGDRGGRRRRRRAPSCDRYDEVCDRLGERPAGGGGGEAQRRAGPAAGPDRRARPVGARPQRRAGHGGPAPAAAPTRRWRTLSGGEKRRVALCRLLISNPDVLLLDEPTNHLDAESVAWLETYLKKFTGTLVVVTHDRYFLNNVTGWILELDGGRAYPVQGQLRDAGWSRSRRCWSARASRPPRGSKLLEQELAWVRLNPSGAAGQEQGAPEALRGTGQPAGGHARGQPGDPDPARPAAGRPGGARREPDARPSATALIMENVNFDLPRGGIVGVIGAQRRGQDHAVPDDHRAGAADVRRTDRRPDGRACPTWTSSATRWTRTTRSTRRSPAARRSWTWAGEPMNGRAYCSRFNFRGADQQKKVGQALRRRAQPRAPGQAAARAAATCCCSTSRPTTST